MSAGLRADERRESPNFDDARARSERAILLALLSLRGLHLAQGAVTTAAGWRSYRRPRLVVGLLAISAAESAWLAYRIWTRRAVDGPTPALIDAGIGFGGLVALAAATTASDRTTWMNWMSPITLGSGCVAATSLRRPAAAAVTTTLAATYMTSARSSLSAGRSARATTVAGTLGYAGFFIAADRFATHLRASALGIEAARRDAVEHSERIAVERARHRQHQILNESVLETLDLVADGWDEDHDRVVRARIRREAARLRRALRDGNDDMQGGFAGTMRALVEDFASEGLNIELLLGELDTEPTAASIDALYRAVGEALLNVVRHAEVSRVVVRARSIDDQVELTVRDHGIGWDTALVTPLGGIATRVIAPIESIGGSVTVQSSPGRGTLVVLVVPHDLR